MHKFGGRRAAIYQRLQQSGTVLVTELAAELGVTEMTIRRDLAAMERDGALIRFRGGAVLPHAMVHEVPYASKLLDRQSEKARIGEAAAALVPEGATVGLAAGTTVAAAARALLGKGRLTVVTSAVNVGWELAQSPEIQLIMTGGRVREDTLCMVGPTAEQALRDVAVDIAFVGVDGISVEFGFTTPNQEEAHIHQVMLSRARKRVVVADSSKFGKVAFARIATLEQIDTLVTDTNAPPDQVEALRRAGVEVLMV